MNRHYTPDQLKTALAKMLPKRFKACNCPATKEGKFCGSFYFDNNHVKDNELLEVCWVIEQQIMAAHPANPEGYIEYSKALYEAIKLYDDEYASTKEKTQELIFRVIHASWEQRTIALAHFLGVKIK